MEDPHQLRQGLGGRRRFTRALYGLERQHAPDCRFSRDRCRFKCQIDDGFLAGEGVADRGCVQGTVWGVDGGAHVSRVKITRMRYRIFCWGAFKRPTQNLPPRASVSCDRSTQRQPGAGEGRGGLEHPVGHHGDSVCHRGGAAFGVTGEGDR